MRAFYFSNPNFANVAIWGE